MISRFLPPNSLTELCRAALERDARSVRRFEEASAAKFGFPHGLFFPYGRAALHTLLRTLGWKDAEVVMPAYTCVVAAHAVVLSGNRVRFADSAADHFLVPPHELEAALSPATRMVVATPLFGYPIDRLGYRRAIRVRAPNAMVVYDLAHAFAVEDDEGPQAADADAAILGFGIGKQISTLYGGMLLLRDQALCDAVRELRNRTFRKPGMLRPAKLWAYGVAARCAFREPLLSAVDWLERKTPLLYGITEYYYGKGGPSLPVDACELPTPFQARLGLRQLADYDRRVDCRTTLARFYHAELSRYGFYCFGFHGRPTFSHFPLAVERREAVAATLRGDGIQVGKLIDYSCPQLPGYESTRGTCPNAAYFGARMLNLPNWPGLGVHDARRVVASLCRVRDRRPEWFRTSNEPAPSVAAA